MRKRKIEIHPSDFPPQIRDLLKNASVYDSSCSSDAAVYYADSGYYIKTGTPGSLAEEAAMSRLFYSFGLGVEVMVYISSDRDYLVTREAMGEDLTHYLKDPEKLCKLLAASLRKLHGYPISGVPLSSRHRHYLEAARGDEQHGTHEAFVLMDRYMVASKKEAWSIMQSNKHLLKADTLIHGDACLPNIIQSDGRFSAFIDFNMAGVGDRHIDIYWAIWSLGYNLKTDAYTDLFLDLYGRDAVNEDMLRLIAAFESFG